MPKASRYVHTAKIPNTKRMIRDLRRRRKFLYSILGEGDKRNARASCSFAHRTVREREEPSPWVSKFHACTLPSFVGHTCNRGQKEDNAVRGNLTSTPERPTKPLKMSTIEVVDDGKGLSCYTIPFLRKNVVPQALFSDATDDGDRSLTLSLDSGIGLTTPRSVVVAYACCTGHSSCITRHGGKIGHYAACVSSQAHGSSLLVSLSCRAFPSF